MGKKALGKCHYAVLELLEDDTSPALNNSCLVFDDVNAGVQHETLL